MRSFLFVMNFMLNLLLSFSFSLSLTHPHTRKESGKFIMSCWKILMFIRSVNKVEIRREVDHVEVYTIFVMWDCSFRNSAFLYLNFRNEKFTGFIKLKHKFLQDIFTLNNSDKVVCIKNYIKPTRRLPNLNPFIIFTVFIISSINTVKNKGLNESPYRISFATEMFMIILHCI